MRGCSQHGPDQAKPFSSQALPLNTPEALPVDSDIKSPRYMQVYSSLYQWIAQGHYAPGARLEPESKLCDMFGVSRITVRKAIGMLVERGLLRTEQGKGTFVARDNPGLAVRADMDQRIQRAKNLVRTSRTERLTIETVEATEDVAADLELEAGAEVLRASYVRVLPEMRIGYVDSHIPAQLGIELTPEDFLSNTLLTILEDKGVTLSGVDHLIGATLADDRLARLLAIDVGAPLVRIKMIMLDTERVPVERVIAYFRADHYEHHMFMARSTAIKPVIE